MHKLYKKNSLPVSKTTLFVTRELLYLTWGLQENVGEILQKFITTTWDDLSNSRPHIYETTSDA